MMYYTIAENVCTCCGHGDYRDFLQIGKLDDRFPPLFSTPDAALAWIADRGFSRDFGTSHFVVVTMEVHE